MMASDLKNGANGKFDKISDDISENESGVKGLIENNNLSPIKQSSLDNRLKRKAKRPSKLMCSDENGIGSVVNVNGSYLRYTKNSRRSRNGFGRGLPKKGIDVMN